MRADFQDKGHSKSRSSTRTKSFSETHSFISNDVTTEDGLTVDSPPNNSHDCFVHMGTQFEAGLFKEDVGATIDDFKLSCDEVLMEMVGTNRLSRSCWVSF